MRRQLAIPLVLTEGFRFFFLFSALFAIFSICAWLLLLQGVDGWMAVLVPRPFMSISQWHGHEMVFGYATGVVAGFFLTAVPNWTKTPPAKAAYICAIGGVWLIGRVALWYSDALPLILVAFCDLIFLPPLLAKLIYSLRHNPQPHNLIFTSLLAVLTATNLLCYLEWFELADDTAYLGIRAGLFTIGMMIFVLGGRVAPAFTRNALRRQGVDEAFMPWTDPRANKVALVLTALFTFSIFIQPPDWVIGILALAAGLSNIWRIRGWQTRRTFHDPILWNMHLGYVMLIVGYFTYGLAQMTGVLTEVAALHMLAVGAIGGMTLAIMARASLGHTGRPLRLSPMMVVTYIVIALAAILRSVMADLIPDFYDIWIHASAGLWLVGFLIFVIAYLPILSSPRAE